MPRVPRSDHLGGSGPLASARPTRSVAWRRGSAATFLIGREYGSAMPARPKKQKRRVTAPDPALRSRARKILTRLAKAYPDWGPTLLFSSPLELLVATILAAQAQDERINEVTRVLFTKYRSPADYAAAPAGVLERDIKATGFYNQKAKSLRAMARGLLDEFGGRSRHRGEPPCDLPEEGLDQGDVVLRSPRSSDLQTDSALPDLSDQRPLPVPEEDEDAACGAAIQPATAPSASSSASPAMIEIPSARVSPASSNGAGARPIASTST